MEKGIREELSLFLIRNHRTKREHVFILYFRSGMEKAVVVCRLRTEEKRHTGKFYTSV